MAVGAASLTIAQEQRHAGGSARLVAVGEDICVAPGARKPLVIPGEAQAVDALVHPLHQPGITGDGMPDLDGPRAAQRAEALGYGFRALEAAGGREGVARLPLQRRVLLRAQALGEDVARAGLKIRLDPFCKATKATTMMIGPGVVPGGAGRAARVSSRLALRCHEALGS